MEGFTLFFTVFHQDLPAAVCFRSGLTWLELESLFDALEWSESRLDDLDGPRSITPTVHSAFPVGPGSFVPEH